jgi:hypothetical protein
LLRADPSYKGKIRTCCFDFFAVCLEPLKGIADGLQVINSKKFNKDVYAKILKAIRQLNHSQMRFWRVLKSPKTHEGKGNTSSSLSTLQWAVLVVEGFQRYCHSETHPLFLYSVCHFKYQHRLPITQKLCVSLKCVRMLNVIALSTLSQSF